MKKYILFILVMMGAYSLRAQSPPQIKPLTIGDTVPDIVFQHMLNYKDSTAKLSDFRGKLVILDFFATWCGSCIAALPKLDSLQKQFADSIQIIVIDYELKSKVKSFLRTNPFAKQISFPFVTSDSILNQLFLHRTIPHEVWINKDGALKAITYSEYVNAQNIKRLLQEENWNLPLKKDVMQFNVHKPLLQEGNGGTGSNLIYRSLLTRYLNGVSSGSSSIRDTTNRTVRMVYINQPILALYAAAMNHYSNRVVLEVKDTQRYILGSQLWTTWMQNNSYCYELTMPMTITLEKAKELMLKDLNRYLGLNGRVEMRMVKCWALTCRNPDKILLKAGSGKREIKLYGNRANTKYIHNGPISELVDAMNYYHPGDPLYPVVVDEIHYKGNIDLDLQVESIHDIPAMRNALQPYGLDLIPVKRELKMFVLTEKGFKQSSM